MPTRDEKLEELTKEERAALDRLRASYLHKIATSEVYGEQIDTCQREGLSYRIMADFLGISHVSIFNHRKRWLKRKRNGSNGLIANPDSQ